MHFINIIHRPAFFDGCVVNIIVSQRLRTIAQMDDYEFQEIQDVKHIPTYSIPPFSFSFNEFFLWWMFRKLFNEEMSRRQLLLNPTTRQYLVTKISDYAKNLVCNLKEGSSFGYVIFADILIVHLQLSDVAKGIYDRGNREQVITCSVCLKDVENGMKFNRFQCSHIFHTSCVDRWLKRSRSCPNCRYKLKDKLSVEEDLADRFLLDDAIARLPVHLQCATTFKYREKRKERKRKF